MKNKLMCKFLILFITLVIILNLFIFITAGQAATSQSIIIIEYDQEAANNPFLPIDMVKEIPVTIDYHIRGFVDDVIPIMYEGVDNFVYLDIVSHPDWCTATLSPTFLLMEPSHEGVIEDITLIIKINQEAHAFDPGLVCIKAKVNNMGAVIGGTFYSNISFNPGFLPVLKINVPEGTSKRIGPLQTASFNVEIENLGNAKTLVTSKVLNLPEGWTVSTDNDVTIGTQTIGDSSSRNVYFTIKPPMDFGYHNEREMISISFTPSYFEDNSMKGEEYIVNLLIHSEGFSTPGFEIVTSLVGIVFLLFAIKNQNIKKNNSNKNNFEREK